MKELDIAKRIASGELPPLVMYENHLLAAIRVTGTKTALEGEKPIYRKPEYYLHDDFLQSIQGVPVIFEHPDNGEYLSHDEYQNRNVGSIFYPYLKDSEVWAVARIYNDAIEGFKRGIFKDTSPAVAVIKSKELQLKDGSVLHIEGEPIYTDHIALLVNAGVWSKSLTNLTGIPTMDNPQTEKIEQKTPPGNQVPVQQTVQEAEPDGDITSMLKTIAAGIARTEAAQAAQGELITALQAQIGKVEKLEAAEVETKPKMDAVEQKIQSIEQNLPAQMSDDDKVELADTVEKTNHAFRKINMKIPQLPSDTKKSFIARAIEKGKQFNALFKDVPTIELVANDAVMATCHAQILASVEAYANTPEALPQNGNVEKIERRDASGKVVREWRANMFNVFRKHAGGVI